MKTYYILRHGLATHNTQGYGKDIVSAHLLPEGREPIEKMAKFLTNVPTDYNVTSAFIRCRETANVISSITGKEFAEDARLNESPIDENYNGETFEEFRNRILMFLLEMEQDDSKQTILICTHGSVIAGIKHILINGKFLKEDYRDFPMPGVLVIIHPDGRIEEKDFTTK